MNKFPQKDLEETVQHLKNGGLILYPSDTVWALGCDAENEAAVSKIASIKGLSSHSPFVILVSNLKMLQYYVPQLPPKALNLIEFYERPMTILYGNSCNLPDMLKSEDGLVAIRFCREPFCSSFINAFGKAVVATLPVRKNEPVPKSYKEISDDIKNGVDYSVTYNRNAKNDGAPSTMVSLDENNELVFLRKG
jgi:L-threonylcarbamoyladenylate synthase